MISKIESLTPQSVLYKTIMFNLKSYPLGYFNSSTDDSTLVEVKKAISRGVNAVTIGALDLQHISEHNTPTRQTDYEDAVKHGLRKWWKKEVLEESLILLKKYVMKDMEIITGM